MMGLSQTAPAAERRSLHEGRVIPVASPPQAERMRRLIGRDAERLPLEGFGLTRQVGGATRP